jgi:hypothetical protein
MLSTEFSPRLSVWQQVGADWQCVAYADLNPVWEGRRLLT